MGDAGITTERRERATASAPFATVLCAVDGRDGAAAAVEQAAALCAPGGRLTMLLVTPLRAPARESSPAVGPLRTGEIIRNAATLADAAGVELTVDVEPATPPARVIAGWSREHDLLALGMPSLSWLGAMFVAGVADSALCRLPRPLLVARPAAARREQPHGVATPDGLATAVGVAPPGVIVVASDGLAGSEEPVTLAARLARGADRGVALVHATGRQHHGPHERISHQQRVLRAAGVQDVDIHVEGGSAHDVIVRRAAELGASLVVMGSRRAGGLRAIGSVSRRVLHEAPCSVLLAPGE